MRLQLSFLVLLLAVLVLSFSEAEAGSIFIRWGRKRCPSQSEMMYVGVAAGKHYTHKGSGTNRLCMTRDPMTNDPGFATPASIGVIYGAEYQHISGHHDRNVPCSVCLASQSTTIMVPGAWSCPRGWTFQYYGYLASELWEHYGSEYVCLDHSPEDDDSGRVKNEDGNLFYYVLARCGVLPCDKYQNKKIVSCVVCSK